MAARVDTGRGLAAGQQLSQALLARLEGSSIAVMLYGSQARGDARADSDVDVLQLVERGARSYSVGPINVSAYTPAHLQDLAQRGSLFVRHLRSDGVILFDRSGTLEQILDNYRAPSTFDAMRAELAAVVTALELPGATRYEPAASRAAAFAVRSLLYAACAEVGIEEYDVVRAATQIRRPEVGLDLRSPVPQLGRLLRHARQFLQESGTHPGTASATDFEEAVIWTGSSHPAAGALLEAVMVGDAQIDYTSLTLPIA